MKVYTCIYVYIHTFIHMYVEKLKSTISEVLHVQFHRPPNTIYPQPHNLMSSYKFKFNLLITKYALNAYLRYYETD